MKDALITAAGTVLAAIIGYFTYKKTTFQKKYGKRKLKYHPIHLRMNDFKEYVDYGINAENDGREKLVKDFLTHMMDTYQRKFKEIAEVVDSRDLSNDELKELNLKTLHEAINERSTFFYTEDYSNEERKSLDLLLRKYQSKQRERIKYFKQDIKKVIDSKYYDDQITMQSLIFDKYIGELSHVLTWFEDVIDEINGDFHGLKFKGEHLNGVDKNKNED